MMTQYNSDEFSTSIELDEKGKLYDDLQEFLLAFDLAEDDPALIGGPCPCSRLDTGSPHEFGQLCSQVEFGEMKLVPAGVDLLETKSDDQLDISPRSDVSHDRKRKGRGDFNNYSRPTKIIKVTDIFDFPSVRQYVVLTTSYLTIETFPDLLWEITLIII
jgi:hypothetical protein